MNRDKNIFVPDLEPVNFVAGFAVQIDVFALSLRDGAQATIRAAKSATSLNTVD